MPGVRRVKKLLTVLVVAALALGVPGKADAGVIDIANNSNDINHFSYVHLENISGAQEGYSAGDLPWIEDPSSPYTDIYTRVDNHILGIDHRPVNTNGWEIILSVNGQVNNIDNFLEVYVFDPTDLSSLRIRNKANPSEYYDIATVYDNDVVIPIANVTNPGNGRLEYAVYEVLINQDGVVPEPSGLALLALGAVGFASRRRS